jgi:VanZ like family
VKPGAGRWGVLLLIVWLAVLGTITLLPSTQRDLPPEVCLICGERGAADALLNLLFFVPFGFLLTRRSGLRAGLIWPVVVSFVVELLQHAIPGRNPSLGDIFFNGLGGAIGATIGWFGPWLDARHRRLTAVAFGAALAASVGGLALTAWLSAPAPPDAPYYGQWTADLGHYDHYQGRVLRAVIGDDPLPQGLLPEWPRMRARVRAHEAVTVDALAGPAPADVAPVLSVYDAEQREVFLVGLDGDDVVVHYRTRAADWRLDYMEQRARDLAAGVRPGDTLRFAVDPGPNGMDITLNGRTVHLAEPRLARGWQLLIGADLPWLDALWLFALFLPTGLFAASLRALVAGGAIMLALLIGLPFFTWTAPTAAWAVVVGVMGLVGGWVVRYLVGPGGSGRLS